MLHLNELEERFAAFGQGHVFRGIDKLSTAERERLFWQAEQIDLENLDLLLKALEGKDYGKDAWKEVVPARYIKLPETGEEKQQWHEARLVGDRALQEGRVAIVMLSGGQASRLGSKEPKGMVSVTPVTRKSLFQVFAEKVHAVEKRYGRAIPWYIMTSPEGHEATVNFFEKHHFFGLKRISFFKQGVMPIVDENRKILLVNQEEVAFNPNGHGGLFMGLEEAGCLREMEAEGIDVVSIFQVDNPFVNCLDPLFLGFHIMGGSEMSSKMVKKAYPEEKVGIFCERRGELSITEYSDMPDFLAKACDDGGELKYLAANVAIHLLDRLFIERVCRKELPYHCVHRKVHIYREGEEVEVDGIKFEKFIFDALPFAQNAIVMEIVRNEEFSPIKNKTGKDSLETCYRDQLKRWMRWLERVGVEIPVDGEGVPLFPFEISPLFADSEEVFVENWGLREDKPLICHETYLE